MGSLELTAIILDHQVISRFEHGEPRETYKDWVRRRLYIFKNYGRVQISHLRVDGKEHPF